MGALLGAAAVAAGLEVQGPLFTVRQVTSFVHSAKSPAFHPQELERGLCSPVRQEAGLGLCSRGA